MKRNTDNMEIKRRSTFAILFYINRTKVRKDGTCQLLCKISIDAKWEQIGTKVSVNPAIWNPEKGRADGRSENAITVNQAIDDLTKEIKEHYRRIKNSLGFITAEQVKNAVMGVGQKPLTLLALFREHNEEFKKRIGVDRIKESYDSYLRSYKHLSAFVQEKRGVEDVLLRSLDRVFYDDFELFLRTDRNLSPKSVHEHLYRLKKMTMRAVSQGTIRRDPYCRLHPELPKRKSRHLKLEDLKVARMTPTRSEPMEKIPLEEDEDIGSDDVEQENKGLTEEEREELMAPVDAEPDPDFNTALTIEEINNVAEVLTSGIVDEQKALRAARTIHYKLSETEILAFLTDKLSNLEKVNGLLDKYLGNRRGVSGRKGSKEDEPFDIDKYA